MTLIRKRKSRLSGRMDEAIDELASRGWNASQILRELETKFDGDVPDLRTIQRRLAERPADRSGVWSLRAAEPEEATLVLPVLAEVIHRSDGNKTALTVAEAGMVATVRRVAPDLPPWWAYRLARLCVEREAVGAPTTDLDWLLAFAPWRDRAAGKRFEDAVERQWGNVWLDPKREGELWGPGVLAVLRWLEDRWLRAAGDLEEEV